jgi:flagellar basal-body rod protein FlgC
MGYMDAVKISASGLAAQRTRMNIISSNLANINTTRAPEGGPYLRKNVVFESTSPTEIFGDVLQGKLNQNLQGVKVTEIKSDESAVRMKYDPTHPDANEEGYVALPDINMMKEMVDMMEAKRAFEANISAMKAARDMAMRALEIGR